MNEWGAFLNAIRSNDTARVISLATPEFVKRYPNCFSVFCGMHIKFVDSDAVVANFHANKAKSDDVIHFSVKASNPQLIKTLLKFGYGVNKRNYQNFTPLDLSCYYTNKTIQTILIDAGGEMYLYKDTEIQELIDFRKNARIACITCIGIGRKRREGRDVFAIIARIVWGERIKRFI